MVRVPLTPSIITSTSFLYCSVNWKIVAESLLVHRLISGRDTVGCKRLWMLVSCPRNTRYFGDRTLGASKEGIRGDT
jgi:hypothetical protein